MNHDPIAPLAWHDGLLLGHAPMDEEHEALLAHVAALGRASDVELADTLDALAAQARRHFSAEERWMIDTCFPARACHAGEHEAVLRSIEGVRRRVAAGEHAAARGLASALADWFPGHADYLDAPLAHWLCKQRLGGTPVVVRRRLDMASLETRC